MHFVNPNTILDKTNVAVRNASCTKGWLRLVIECFFGVITVASFIVILIIAMKSPQNPPRDVRCVPQGCRVICNNAPYFEDFQDNIYDSLATLEASCERIFLTLQNPMFTDSKMPQNWLRRLKPIIHELTIVNGNLKYIEPLAFMTSFAGCLRSLVFVNITLASWPHLMLAGLINLEELSVRDSDIGDISASALEPVDDTLKSLAITQAGPWNPANLTGSSHFENLRIVVFSSNHFEKVLGPSSFSTLYKCKILYLNSCKIKVIQEGAFDNLQEIEIIYLNNNFLTHVPSGLFDTIITRPYPRAKISLQHNDWYCDCSSIGLQQLAVHGMLLIDPICHSPKNMNGKFVSYLNELCKNNTRRKYSNTNILNKRNIIDINNAVEQNVLMDNSICEHTNSRELHVISPVSNFECQFYNIETKNLPKNYITSLENDLIKPTFAVQKGDFSMVEITSPGNESYGLLWYHSKCPNKIFCVNTLPNVLRIYNIDCDAEYVFCPVRLLVENIESGKCINFSSITTNIPKSSKFTLNIVTAVICLVFGAMCVFAIIRKHPALLTGNKRILLVKHKNVDALILPPKVPPRLSLSPETSMVKFDNKDIFVVSNNSPNTFIRTKSMISSKSMAPSYISALEPTDDQLAEWRLRHHFDNASKLASLSLEVCTFSWIYDEKATQHTSQINENNYDNLTQVDLFQTVNN